MHKSPKLALSMDALSIIVKKFEIEIPLIQIEIVKNKKFTLHYWLC